MRLAFAALLLVAVASPVLAKPGTIVTNNNRAGRLGANQHNQKRNKQRQQHIHRRAALSPDTPHRLTQTHGDDDIAAIRDPHQVNIFAYDELAALLSQIEAEDTGRDVFSAQSVPNLAKFARSIVEALDSNPKFTLDSEELQELVLEEMGLDDTDEEVLESFATAMKRLERTGVIQYNSQGKIRVALMKKEDATRKSDPYGERGNGGNKDKDKNNNNEDKEEDEKEDEKKMMMEEVRLLRIDHCANKATPRKAATDPRNTATLSDSMAKIASSPIMPIKLHR